MKIQRNDCRVHNARKYCRQLPEWRLRDWPIHLIRLIWASATSISSDGPRQHCRIGDLLMRMRWSGHWQTCLTTSLLMSSRACSKTGLRDWNRWSYTMENTLLNGWSKSLWFRRAAEIGGGVITFFTPYIGCKKSPDPPAYFTGY